MLSFYSLFLCVRKFANVVSSLKTTAAPERIRHTPLFQFI
jgi:hypothetical protein